jgi:hypothetical protein
MTYPETTRRLGLTRAGLDTLSYWDSVGQNWISVAKKISETALRRNDHLFAAAHGIRVDYHIFMHHAHDSRYYICMFAVPTNELDAL